MYCPVTYPELVVTNCVPWSGGLRWDVGRLLELSGESERGRGSGSCLSCSDFMSLWRVRMIELSSTS